jgi:hypothetical protein
VTWILPDCLQDMFRRMPACCIVMSLTMKFCVVYLHILEACACHNLTSQKKYRIFIHTSPPTPRSMSFSFVLFSRFFHIHFIHPFLYLFFSFFQSPVMTSFFPFFSLSLFLPCHFSICISLISAISPFLCLYELAVLQLRSPDVASK